MSYGEGSGRTGHQARIMYPRPCKCGCGREVNWQRVSYGRPQLFATVLCRRRHDCRLFRERRGLGFVPAECTCAAPDCEVRFIQGRWNQKFCTTACQQRSRAPARRRAGDPEVRQASSLAAREMAQGRCPDCRKRLRADGVLVSCRARCGWARTVRAKVDGPEGAR